eukprot:gb/GECG01001567.1/.p1 GENE.gb/GECG01001567.1/~~gb/GECG01001567.1/.p1  ORF type:complete len:489 (+),score=65.80 gb/GECG01001567.1/:1-1467(+)
MRLLHFLRQQRASSWRLSSGKISIYLPVSRPTIRAKMSTSAAHIVSMEDVGERELGKKLEQSLSLGEVAPQRELVSVAPMMEYTDHHFRQLLRLLTRKTKLYTEMVVDTTILHCPDIESILSFDPIQKPLALQIGGSDPESLAKACEKVIGYGYDEVNLNCGCPSERVATKACFGARLMLDPELVKKCTTAMREVLLPHGIDVTVKCRLGADEMDSYEELKEFIEKVAESGVTHFIVHARKCWLQGLSPKQNRTIPLIKYHWVARLAKEFPHLRISLNGEIKTMDECKKLLTLRSSSEQEPGILDSQELRSILKGMDDDSSWDQLLRISTMSFPENNDLSNARGLYDSMMLGRESFANPWLFSTVDSELFGCSDPNWSRREVIEKYVEYAEQLLEEKRASGKASHGHGKINELCKPLLRLFSGCRGGGSFRRHINDNLNMKKMSDLREAVFDAMKGIPPEELDKKPTPKTAHGTTIVPPESVHQTADG